MSDTRNHRVDDLDRLVSELHQITSARSAPVTSDTPDLGDWLRQVRDQDGSDLLLVASLPPLARVKGEISRLRGDSLSGEDIETAVSPIVPSRLRDRYRDGEAIDLAFTLKGLGRFRMNLHRERGRPAAAIRALPTRVPRVSDLHFSHDIALLAALPRGLVLVCGPTGSGKTTTLAALIAEINASHPRHIVTVEDPIEYEHGHGRSVIEQVEIGIDAPDFPTALRAAMRQAPDVIVVGEMRDPETMRIALAAAETGHLVLATVHATDAAAALSRIADAFPVERQNAVRQELAMAMAAVLTQSLVQTKTRSLVPVAELLVVSYGARQHIRKNALQHLNQEITITRKSGSFTLEESLAKLVLGGVIDRGDAMLRAAHPDELESLLRGA
jgi:twitching motility protein PilT